MEAKLKRSKKRSDKNRDSVFRFRLTEDEKQLVKKMSKQFGFRSMSKYLRSLITETKSTTAIDRQALLLLNAELGKDGSNLNQIARAINIRMKTGETINVQPDLINSTISNIDKLTQLLFRLLKDGHSRESKG